MKESYQILTRWKKLLSDTTTPVSIYLRIRDLFPNSILLESADYHQKEEGMSYIACDLVASIRLQDGYIQERYPDKTEQNYPLKQGRLIQPLQAFSNRFLPDPSIEFPNISSGLFGYLSYDSVQYFENIRFKQILEENRKVPEMIYGVYKYIIAIHHFNNEMTVFEHNYGHGEGNKQVSLEELIYIIQNKNVTFFPFKIKGKEESNFTDEEFLKGIAKIKTHIHRGDVFQLQLSRRFSQDFLGDDFNVYRTLRSINPSPYLFYFDFSDFRIFGSSPEAQIIIRKGKAKIHPIAGTFKRVENAEENSILAEKLKKDPKETAEHVMLVDLARNDLSRSCSNVKVEAFKEVEFYSHVVHLVSKVGGDIRSTKSPLEIVADTFPAGTLTGAPKYRAMELIDYYEQGSRGIYGGAIGYLTFQGEFNHAILIRSFLSRNHVLYYQAAGGIVDQSIDQNELEEVNNKLRALKKAIQAAQTLLTEIKAL